MATEMALDIDNLVIVIQIIALILLTIGVYPYRIRTKNRNLIMHGFLSIIALTLNLATVFLVMTPAFISEFLPLSELSTETAIVWLHTGLGIAAIALGIAIIISWITHPLGELGCSRTWRLMIPTFSVWTASLILGVVIHLTM